MSQTELAIPLEITQPHMAGIETGRRRISLEALLKVCEVLHVSLLDLLPSPQDPKKPGPRPKLAVAYEKLTQLPEKEQNAVLVMIDSLSNAHPQPPPSNH